MDQSCESVHYADLQGAAELCFWIVRIDFSEVCKLFASGTTGIARSTPGWPTGMDNAAHSLIEYIKLPNGNLLNRNKLNMPCMQFKNRTRPHHSPNTYKSLETISKRLREVVRDGEAWKFLNSFASIFRSCLFKFAMTSFKPHMPVDVFARFKCFATSRKLVLQSFLLPALIVCTSQ